MAILFCISNHYINDLFSRSYLACLFLLSIGVFFGFFIAPLHITHPAIFIACENSKFSFAFAFCCCYYFCITHFIVHNCIEPQKKKAKSSIQWAKRLIWSYDLQSWLRYTNKSQRKGNREKSAVRVFNIWMLLVFLLLPLPFILLLPCIIRC